MAPFQRCMCYKSGYHLSRVRVRLYLPGLGLGVRVGLGLGLGLGNTYQDTCIYQAWHKTFQSKKQPDREYIKL